MKYNKTIKFDSNDNPEIYSIRIANLLNEQGLTQEDLAKMSGVSKSSITAWIFGDKNGKRTEPKILGLNCVAKALGVSVDYLIGNTDVKQLDIKKQEISNSTKGTKRMYNLEIRMKIKQNRLCHYEVAREIGISEATLCRWLREEMNKDRKELVSSAIDKLLRGERNA